MEMRRVVRVRSIVPETGTRRTFSNPDHIAHLRVLITSLRKYTGIPSYSPICPENTLVLARSSHCGERRPQGNFDQVPGSALSTESVRKLPGCQASPQIPPKFKLIHFPKGWNT